MLSRFARRLSPVALVAMLVSAPTSSSAQLVSVGAGPAYPGGEFKDRFRFAWYESGHMMYLRKPDLAASNNDLRNFIKWSLEGSKDYPRRARTVTTP